MTRQEITQVYYYEKEIELLEKKLADLEDTSLPSLKPGTSSGASGKVSDPTGNTAAKAAEIKTMIESHRQMILDKRIEIYEYINELDDPLIRLIIMHRCIDLCTWAEVAERIGGSNTENSVRMLFNRHFEDDEHGQL